MKTKDTVEKCDETGNIYENKGNYPLEARMYMKTGRLMFFNRKSTRTSLRISTTAGGPVLDREENSFFERTMQECL
jgi:hypothetical protein